MKRIMLLSGFIGAILILSAVALPSSFSLVATSILFLASAVLIFLSARKKELKSYAIFVILISLLLARFTLITLPETEYATSFIGKKATVSGVVTDLPEKVEHYSVYEVEIDTVDGQKLDNSVRVSMFTHEDIKPYYRITASAEFIEQTDNYKYSSFAEKRYVSVKTDNISIVGREEGFHLYEYALILRKGITDLINESMPSDVSGILCGFLTGNTESMSDETVELFRATGVSHTVAVSGFHMSVVAATISFMLIRLKYPRRRYNTVMIPLLLIYSALSGFSPSSVRSVVMIGAVFEVTAFGRRPDRINLLGAVVYCMMLVRPYIIFSLSFLLSATAVAGIIIIVPALNKYVFSRIKARGILRDILDFVFLSISSSVSAGIGTFPVMLFTNEKISTVAVLSNLLISLAVTCSIILGMLTVAVALVLYKTLPSEIVFTPIKYILYYILAALTLVSKIPFSYVTVNKTVTAAVVMTALIAAAIYLIFIKDRRKRNA